MLIFNQTGQGYLCLLIYINILLKDAEDKEHTQLALEFKVATKMYDPIVTINMKGLFLSFQSSLFIFFEYSQ